jgi:DNA-binding IclR family transcriptional regulator
MGEAQEPKMVDQTIAPNRSIIRALQIVELLAHTDGQMRLLDISKRSGMGQSSAFRILNTLVGMKYVEQDLDSKKYSLTMKWSYIGNLVSAKLSMRDVARPILADLSRKTGESVSLVIEQDSTAVYIDCISGRDNLFRTLHLIGKAAPLHCTATGKCLLLNYSSSEIDHYVESKRLKSLTKKSIRTRDELAQQIAVTRSRGFAVDDEECEEGVRCVAAPIKDDMGKVVASTSVTGPSSRLTKARIRSIKNLVIEAADEIAQRIAWR